MHELVDIFVQYEADHQQSEIILIKLLLFNARSTPPLYFIEQGDTSIIQNNFMKRNWLLVPADTPFDARYLYATAEFARKVSKYLFRRLTEEAYLDVHSVPTNSASFPI